MYISCHNYSNSFRSAQIDVSMNFRRIVYSIPSRPKSRLRNQSVFPNKLLFRGSYKLSLRPVHLIFLLSLSSSNRVTSEVSNVSDITSTIVRFRPTKSSCIARKKGEPTFMPSCHPWISREERRDLYHHCISVGRVNKSFLLSATSTLSTQLDKLPSSLANTVGGKSDHPRSFLFSTRFLTLVPLVAIDGCLGKNFRIYSPISCDFIASVAENLREQEGQSSTYILAS